MSDSKELEAKHRIKNTLLTYLATKKEAGIIFAAILIPSGFALGTYIGRLIFIN